MLKKLLLFFGGKAVFTLDEKLVVKLINIFMHCPVTRSKPVRKGGKVTFSTRLSDRRKMREFLDRYSFDYQIQSFGLPIIIYRYRRRYGMMVGFALIIAILTLSTLFVWSMEVEGNEILTEDEVLEALSNAGMGIGTFTPAVDYDKLSHQVLMESEDIAWMGVNVSGTHVTVSIRERLKKKEVNEFRNVRAANLVANENGLIFYTTVFGGTTVVNPGDAVKKGDLLVSGFRENKEGGFSLERASGSVYAYVSRTINVEVPFEQREKVYTGEENAEQYINIFGKEIKVLKKSGNSPEMYDIIKTKDNMTFFDVIFLPLSVTKNVERGYSYEVKTLSLEEAEQSAEELLDKKMVSEFKNCEILEILKEKYYNDDVVGITVEVYCIADIAKVREISTDR